MNNVQIVSSVIALVIFLSIYFLVRRDHLAPRQAFKWLIIALIVLALGIYPFVIDVVGKFLGIAYPPIIPLIIAIGVAMIKILVMDIERNKMLVTQQRIVQKLAMLEAELDKLQNEKNKQVICSEKQEKETVKRDYIKAAN